MQRTRAEIDEEIRTLQELQPLIPETSAEGDDNEEAINAAIDVLTGHLELDEIFYAYSNGDDAYVLDQAQAAHRWLNGQGAPVSEGWRELVPDYATAA